ncbi:MAG: MlaD family protein [Bdellovibrionota bacterium]
MQKALEIEMKVGLFVTIGTGLIMMAILVLGSAENFLARQNRYVSYFQSVDGLIPGAKVVLAGIQVGTIDTIEFSPERGSIEVKVAVLRKFSTWLRKDTEAEIATQGVLGDKYISLSAGSKDQPPIEPGAEIHPRPSKDLGQFLNKSDQLLVNLTSVTASLDRILRNFDTANRSDIFFKGMAESSKNLSLVTEKLSQALAGGQLAGVLKNLNGILDKVNGGTGTLGALVNDPGLYDDAKALMGGANRNRIVRNLVRQTIKKSEEDDAKASKAAGESQKK